MKMNNMMDVTRTKLPNIEENIFSFYFSLYAKKRAREEAFWRRLSRVRTLKFALHTYTLLIIPIVRDSVKGYKKMPDKAWLLHPLACWLTLLTYGIKFMGYWR